MNTQTQAPPAVRGAFLMWLIAVTAGIFETVLMVASGRAGDGAAAGVAVRVAVFAAAVLVAVQMRAGRAWARLTLLIGLGVLGTLSLVLDPLLRLIDGAFLPDLVTGLSPVEATFAASRAVHVMAVLTACGLMFLPAANAYFRQSRRNRVTMAGRT